MSSLFGTLGIARQALAAQQYGLEVTQNNVANVNTPGLYAPTGKPDSR